MGRRRRSDCALSSVGMDVVICVDFLKCERAGCGTVWSYCTPERTSKASYM